MSDSPFFARAGTWATKRFLTPSICLVILVALLMRLQDLAELPLWIDEAYSVWFALQDWTYLWTEVPQFETHPSFYYSLLKLWSAFGMSEFSVRLLSTLFNVASIPLVALAAYRCGDERSGAQAAILASILFACSATQLHASQDARPYALMSFAMALALASSLVVMTAGVRAQASLRQILAQDRPMLAAFVGIGIGISLLCWSHNFGPVIALILGVCLFGFWFSQGSQRGLLINLLFSATLAFLLYIPNFPIILMQTASLDNQGFWIGRPGIQAALDTIHRMPLGHSKFNGIAFIVFGYLSFLAGLAGFLSLIFRKRHIPLAVPVTLLVMAAAPAMLSFIISRIGQPIFLFRTLQASQVPVLIGMAYLPALIHGYLPIRLRWMGTLPLLLLAATALWSFQLGNIRGAHEDYKTIVPRIAAETAPLAPRLVVYPPELELPFRYYSDRLNTPLEILSVPAPYPARGVEYSYPAGGGGSPGMTSEIANDLLGRLGNDTKIWIATRNLHLYDPQNMLMMKLSLQFPCLIDDDIANLQLRSRKASNGSCN